MCTGDHDKVTPAADARAIFEVALPAELPVHSRYSTTQVLPKEGSSLHVLPDTGHTIMLERSEVVGDLIAEFVSSVAP